jgi:hypothetical protein
MEPLLFGYLKEYQLQSSEEALTTVQEVLQGLGSDKLADVFWEWND